MINLFSVYSQLWHQISIEGYILISEQRRLRDDEYPLLVRVMLGPHEDVSKLFLMDRQNTEEISSEVAQFLNLSIAECRAILLRYQEEEERETKRVRAK